jgi:hypothetical protein
MIVLIVCFSFFVSALALYLRKSFIEIDYLLNIIREDLQSLIVKQSRKK